MLDCFLDPGVVVVGAGWGGGCGEALILFEEWGRS